MTEVSTNDSLVLWCCHEGASIIIGNHQGWYYLDASLREQPFVEMGIVFVVGKDDVTLSQLVVEIELGRHVILVEEPCWSLLDGTDKLIALLEACHDVSGIDTDVFVCSGCGHLYSYGIQFDRGFGKDDEHDIVFVDLRIVVDIEVVSLQSVHPCKLGSHVIVVVWDSPTEPHFG